MGMTKATAAAVPVHLPLSQPWLDLSPHAFLCPGQAFGVSQREEATYPSSPLASLSWIPFSFTNGWRTFKSFYVGTSCFHVEDNEKRSEGEINSQKAHTSLIMATLMDFPAPTVEVKPKDIEKPRALIRGRGPSHCLLPAYYQYTQMLE
jgi:hypothetical protein